MYSSTSHLEHYHFIYIPIPSSKESYVFTMVNSEGKHEVESKDKSVEL